MYGAPVTVVVPFARHRVKYPRRITVCPLNEVIKIAQAKLRNGAEKSAGARLAQLMVRASLTVNVHHILSRTLIRSYMIIVNYISTDARDMKIGYSSEPVMAKRPGPGAAAQQA
jgi:hypothetical protein